MEENIRFVCVMKDGTVYPLNIAGVRNVVDATFELASSIMHGDMQIDPDEIQRIEDVPG